MPSQESDLAYSTTEAVSGGLIVLYRGAEIGTANDLEHAAIIAAEDAIAAWPEVPPDFLINVAEEMNDRLDSVIHLELFKDNVVQYILKHWNDSYGYTSFKVEPRF